MPQLHPLGQAAPMDVRYRTAHVGGEPIRVINADVHPRRSRVFPMLVAILPIAAVIGLMIFTLAM